ncbi:ParA family protein [Candidatus Woesearchaeota archaeon]|nr:ParA family protein [Candidatus Woesearchaeota archaeon]
MRKIAVFNQKGGVGKTTTAVNLAAGLSRNGKKVVLIDLDPQGSVHTWHTVDAKKNLYHLIVDQVPIGKCISNLGKNFDIIHCDEKLAEAEEFMMRQKDNFSILEQRFTPDLDYDYVILDCPPSLRLMNQNALFYAREIVVPSSTDILGYDALRKTLKQVEKFNAKFGHRLMVSSIIPTLHDARSRVCKTVLKQMREEFTSLLVVDPIRQNAKLKEAPKAHKSIFSYARRSPGAEDYWKLVKLVLENEYMYDSHIKPEKREQALREYFVEGKRREMVIVDNKVTFSFKYIPQVIAHLKGALDSHAEKKSGAESA